MYHVKSRVPVVKAVSREDKKKKVSLNTRTIVSKLDGKKYPYVAQYNRTILNATNFVLRETLNLV